MVVATQVLVVNMIFPIIIKINCFFQKQWISLWLYILIWVLKMSFIQVMQIMQKHTFLNQVWDYAINQLIISPYAYLAFSTMQTLALHFKKLQLYLA